MDMKEFNEKVKPYDSGTDEIVFDVRTFGNRQGEAMDSYLHQRASDTKTTGIGNPEKLVVLLCDSNASIPDSTQRWIAILKAAGQKVEIRQAWSPVNR